MAVRSPALLPEQLSLVGNSDSQLRERFQFLTAARVMVCTVIFGGTVAVYLAEGHSLDDATPKLLLSVIIAIYAVSLVYALQIRLAPRGRLLRLTSISIALDLAAWTVLAYATGGAGSPLSTFFGLSTLTAALVLGGNGTLWTAVSSLSAYGVLALTSALGLVQPPSDQLHIPHNPIETTYQMVVTLTAIVSITAIGGALADRLVVTGDALLRVEASRVSLIALYEDVLRSIPAALVTYTAEGLVDGTNPFAALFLDLEPVEMLGRPAHEVLPFIPRVALDGDAGSSSGDARLKTPYREIPVAYHVAPLYSHDGTRRGGIVVVEDRSHEEGLRHAVETSERFAQLGRLAAGLAHEIRNPLGAISGCVELVRETATLDSEERSLLATVTRDVARLNDLVTDMLQFAKPRMPDRSPVDLSMLARDVVALARTSGGPEARVQITLRAEQPVVATVDAAQYKQVLWNLLRNAAQASRVGTEVEIVVSATEHEAALRVLDRGPGIEPDLRERIFDAFYSGTARGTGLGLAIVKRIADAHHGRVEILEREGGGSIFGWVVPRDMIIAGGAGPSEPTGELPLVVSSFAPPS